MISVVMIVEYVDEWCRGVECMHTRYSLEVTGVLPVPVPEVLPVGPTGRVKQVRKDQRWEPAEGVISTNSDRTVDSRPGSILSCPEAGCSHTYKMAGWIARHIKSCHGLAVPNNPIIPPSVVIADVGPDPFVGRGESTLLQLAVPVQTDSQICFLLR